MSTKSSRMVLLLELKTHQSRSISVFLQFEKLMLQISFAHIAVDLVLLLDALITWSDSPCLLSLVLVSNCTVFNSLHTLKSINSRLNCIDRYLNPDAYVSESRPSKLIFLCSHEFTIVS